MLKPYVRYCSVGHVTMLLDLCPKVLSPRNTKTLSGFWRAMFYPFARMEATFWAPIWAKLAILGLFKVPGSYSYASWDKVGGSWGQVGPWGGHVEAKLGYVMLCWSYGSALLWPCCWFCIPKCFPPSRTKILSGFLWAMFAPFGVK